MNLSSLFVAVLRRWYFTLMVILATAGLCYAVLKVVEPTYETKSYVLIMPPLSPDMPANRLLALGSLTQAKDVLIRELDADETRVEIAEIGVGTKYTVEPDFTSGAPMLKITSVGATASDSEALASDLVERSGELLISLQDTLDVEPKDRITSVVLSRGVADKVGKTQVRALIAVAGAGLGGGLLLIGLLDGYALRRRARPDQDDDPTSAEAAVIDPLRSAKPVRPRAPGRDDAGSVAGRPLPAKVDKQPTTTPAAARGSRPKNKR